MFDLKVKLNGAQMFKKLVIVSIVIVALMQISFAQKAASPAVKKLATQLSVNTVDLFPIQIFENTLRTKNKEAAIEIEASINGKLTEQLEQSNLTEEKKSEIKLKIPDFAKSLSQKTLGIMERDFNVKSWATKSLEKQYSMQFTLVELRRLNTFFKTKNGKAFIKAFNEKVSDGINGKESEIGADGEELFMKFATAVKMPTFEKFTDKLITNVMDDITASIDNWGKKMLLNIQKETDGNLKNEIETFILESVK